MSSGPTRESVVEECRKAADFLMGYPWKVWFWGDSIGMEGLLDASDLTGTEKYSSFVYGAFKAWIPRMQFRSRFDHTAPGVALLRSYSLTKDPEAAPSCAEPCGVSQRLPSDQGGVSSALRGCGLRQTARGPARAPHVRSRDEEHSKAVGSLRLRRLGPLPGAVLGHALLDDGGGGVSGPG